MEKRNSEARPKIEIVRVKSIERNSARPFDGILLRTSCISVREGTQCTEMEMKPVVVGTGKPPIEQSRKFKKNLGPVSRLLRRRHHATCLSTKSCDNIFTVNRSTNSLDWRVGQNVNESSFTGRQSTSLDWRVGRAVSFGSNRLHCRDDTTRSAEQLSRTMPLTGEHLHAPSTKSKIVSLLRRLSPRLPRPGSKGSLQASPTLCPWVQVEYSSESLDGGGREESQESDVSFQQELQLNELRKRMAGITTSSQVTVKTVNEAEEEEEIQPRAKIEVQTFETEYNPYIYRA